MSGTRGKVMMETRKCRQRQVRVKATKYERVEQPSSGLWIMICQFSIIRLHPSVIAGHIINDHDTRCNLETQAQISYIISHYQAAPALGRDPSKSHNIALTHSARECPDSNISLDFVSGFLLSRCNFPAKYIPVSWTMFASGSGGGSCKWPNSPNFPSLGSALWARTARAGHCLAAWWPVAQG